MQHAHERADPADKVGRSAYPHSMVQAAADLAEVARDWNARGRPLCEHTRTDKEYDLGAQTGDRGCLDCGETWWGSGPTPGPAGG